MTIGTQVFSNQYVGNGSTDEFDFDFAIYDSDELVVHLIDASGVATLQDLTADYSIDGVGDLRGGSIEFVTAPAVGVTIDIRPVYELLQPTSFRNQGRFLPESHENAFDRLTRFSQYLYRLAKQALRLPDRGALQDGVLADVEQRKGKYLFFDAVTGAVTYALNIVGTTLTQLVFDAFLIASRPYKRTAAEIAAGVTPVDYTYEPYSLPRYGGVGDNVTINNTAFANWRLACDQADAEGVIPEGQFRISADITLPLKVKCSGRITGAFQVIYRQRTGGWIDKLSCERVYFSGINFCHIENTQCQIAVLDGFDGSTGSFWNEFSEFHADQSLTIDITNFAVNLNSFRGGRIGYLHITGNTSLYAGATAHANAWYGCDFTRFGVPPNGILQDDTVGQMNFIFGGYYEGGANIRGNFLVVGLQGDALGPPLLSRYTQMIGTTGINSHFRDFLSISVNNAARGGCWEWRASAGKPPSFAISGGAAPTVVADATEPAGVGFRYQGTFSAAFSRFIITLQPNGSNRFAATLFFRGIASFAAVSSNDGTGDTSHDGTPVVLNATWSMLRIAGPASITGTTTLSLFVYGAVGGAATPVSIGSVFAGGERGVIAPTRTEDRESGMYTPTLSNVANLDSSTPRTMTYMRVGNTVLVTGRITVDPTAAGGTSTRLGISLPIAPFAALAAADDLSGNGDASVVTESGGIFADIANNRAELNFAAQSNASHDMYVYFSYRMQ